MRGMRFWLATVIGLCGCEALTGGKVDNPVLGPPPPRISAEAGRASLRDRGEPLPTGTATLNQKRSSTFAGGTDSDQTAGTSAGGTSSIRTLNRADLDETSGTAAVRQVGFEQKSGGSPGRLDDRVSGSEVVATVNTVPVLASDILERYGPQMAQARKELDDADFRELRRQIIQKHLSSHIDGVLLVQSLRATMAKDSLKRIDEYINELFAEEMTRLKTQLKVNSRAEIDEALKKQGTSLNELRDAFARERMAMEYLMAKAKTKDVIGRQELLKYYDDHARDYAIPAAVKWQEIVISKSAANAKNEKEAARKAEKTRDAVLLDLKRGFDFGDVARKYSQAANAPKKGAVGWTQRGSLADTKLEELLFEMPVNAVSKVLEDEQEYRIVRVMDRRQAGKKDFELVQDDIRRTLEGNARKTAAKKVISELRAKAVIQTMFDGDGGPTADNGAGKSDPKPTVAAAESNPRIAQPPVFPE